MRVAQITVAHVTVAYVTVALHQNDTKMYQICIIESFARASSNTFAVRMFGWVE